MVSRQRNHSNSDAERVIVARIGDRTFHVPTVCEGLVAGPVKRERAGATKQGGKHDLAMSYSISVEIEIVNGRPTFRRVGIEAQRGARISAHDLSHVAWARVAETVIADNAVEGWDPEPKQAVRNERSRAAGRARGATYRSGESGPRVRLPVTQERLDEVARLRREAIAAGASNKSAYVADILGCSSSAVRNLFRRIDRVA